MIADRALAAPRRRRASPEERVRRLLDAALDLFAERGYHETAVDDVVARARMSKSAFYACFTSKEDCCRELLRQKGGELILLVIEEAARGKDHRERLRRGIRAFVHSCAAQRPLARVLLVESVGISATIEEARQALHGRFAAVVEEEVGRARSDDDLYAGVDPVVFGRTLVGGVNEATAHFLGRAGANPEALAADLCRIFAPESD